jgi:hypothetical protein
MERVMQQPDLNDIARRPARYWNIDGLPELMLGLLWIAWGGAWLFGGPRRTTGAGRPTGSLSCRRSPSPAWRWCGRRAASRNASRSSHGLCRLEGRSPTRLWVAAAIVAAAGFSRCSS